MRAYGLLMKDVLERVKIARGKGGDVAVDGETHHLAFLKTDLLQRCLCREVRERPSFAQILSQLRVTYVNTHTAQLGSN